MALFEISYMVLKVNLKHIIVPTPKILSRTLLDIKMCELGHILTGAVG